MGLGLLLLLFFVFVSLKKLVVFSRVLVCEERAQDSGTFRVLADATGYLQQECVLEVVAIYQDFPQANEVALDTQNAALVMTVCSAWGAAHLMVKNNGSA